MPKNMVLRNHRTRWTLRELRYVEKYYGKESTSGIAETLGRSMVSVRQAARSIGCRKIKVMAPWTEEEVAVLHTYYAGGAGIHRVSQLLPKRNPKAIQAHATKLGILSGAHQARLWNEEELRILHQYYPTMGAKVANKLPGRTKEAVKQMATSLKIRSKKASMAGVTQRRWTEQEWEILTKSPHLSSSVLMEYLPGRSKLSIEKAKERMKGRRPSQ